MPALDGLALTRLEHILDPGVAAYVLEPISGLLSRRMLEHYSYIRIDAKRQALDALDAAPALDGT